MAVNKINISEIIGSPIAISTQKANIFYKQILLDVKSSDDTIEYSFDSITDCTSSFLNASVGKAVMDFSHEELLKFINNVKFIDFPEGSEIWKLKLDRSIKLGTDEIYRSSNEEILDALMS